MDLQEAGNFCQKWLPSWTGNNPEGLLKFYHKDAFYSDPTVKGGLKGHDEMKVYFKKLLGNNPNWVWSAEEIIPAEKGFILKWKAEIPVKDKKIIEYGLDIVEMDDGTIIRNEVYFDTLTLISAIRGSK